MTTTFRLYTIMTRNIIEKIRAEVNRLKAEHQTPTFRGDEYEEGGVNGYQLALDKVLAKLSDLEKSEEPSDGLEEEIDKRWKEWLSEDKEQVDGVLPKSEFAFYARHFYELGRQSKPKVSEDVETEALRSAGVLLSEHFEDEDDDAIRTTALRCWKGGVIHGADWQRNRLLPMIDNICKGCRIQHEKENPVSERLEEEIERFLSNATKMDKGEWKGKYPISEMGFVVTARHFAKWGAEHAKECEECPSRGNTHSYLKGLEDGKKEMKEQMLKEAVEGCVTMYANKAYPTLIGIRERIGDTGDKVKIIIVKED